MRALVATAKHDARIPLSIQLHVLRNIAAKRIPLNCLEENGNFISAPYAGNNVRMPAECGHITHTLEQQTGFEFMEVSVAEDVMTGNVFDEQKVLQADRARSNRDAKIHL